MSEDIIARLRANRGALSARQRIGKMPGSPDALDLAAANEIERLRSALKAIYDLPGNRQDECSEIARRALHIEREL